jgi:hypothetical protein
MLYGPYGKTLDSIHNYNYMAIWVNEHGNDFGDERLLLEIYTGWVQSSIGFGGGPTTHFTMKSFLPTDLSKVRFYQGSSTGLPGSIIKTTVVASPGATAPIEDEANVFAVDGAFVSLEPQDFVGIEGSPLCLVLTATLGLLNCTMHNYTYSVHVLTKHDPKYKQVKIPSDVRPKGSGNADFEPPG